MPLPRGAVELDGHTGCHWVNRIAVVEDEKLVITSCLGGKMCRETVRVFAADTGKLVLAFNEHASFVLSIVIIGPGLVATGDCGGVLCLWRVTTGKCLYRSKHGGEGLWSIAVLDGARFVVGTASGDLILFGHVAGEHVVILQSLKGSHDKLIRSISICGARMVTCSLDRTAKVWDTESWKEIGVLRGHEGDWLGVATDGKHIVTTTGYEENLALNAIYVWDAHTLTLLRVFGVKHGNKIISVALLGRTHVLTASVDRTVLLTEIATGLSAEPISLPFPILAATVTRDGRIAVCGKEESACIFRPPLPYATAIEAERKRVTFGSCGDSASCSSRFLALKRDGVNADIVKPMNDDELSELMCAYLVGFNPRQEEYFLKLRKSMMKALPAAGVFAGHFLIGNSSDDDRHGLAQFVTDELEKDGLVRITTESMLHRFLELLR